MSEVGFEMLAHELLNDPAYTEGVEQLALTVAITCGALAEDGGAWTPRRLRQRLADAFGSVYVPF